ncbi:MAG: anthranilate synthase component I family protein [Ignavibacteriales bacterium]
MSRCTNTSTRTGAGFYFGINPDPEDFVRQCAVFDYIPIFTEKHLPRELDITLLYQRLAPAAPACLLESLIGQENGRYSIIGFSPLHQIEFTSSTGYESDPLHEIIKSTKVPALDFPHFYGGLIGCWSYDFALRHQKLPRKVQTKNSVPDQQFFMPGVVIVYDRYELTLRVFIWVKAEATGMDTYGAAIQDIENIITLAASCPSSNISHRPLCPRHIGHSDFRVNISDEEYCRRVSTAKHHITQGDIFQVVLSRRWSRRSKSSPWKVYQAMRAINPSPYMFYLEGLEFTLIGASPEMQLKVVNRVVKSRPIAGTRKVTGNNHQDELLRQELLSDEKERAEHMMLVDLGRNDVGRVSEAGTVKVAEFMKIEPYSHVVHLVSTVQGRLKPSLEAVDAFNACFPAGTLSGAPKRKAMEIINDLEDDARGLYGGAIGHIGFDGSLDSCITIRSILHRNQTYYLQSGAGIVADSIPKMESEETLSKARVLMLAILEAEEDL